MFNSEMWDKCKERSMMGEERIKQISIFLNDSISKTSDIHAIAEIGVLKGGTSKYLSMMAPSRKIYLFDTFNGLPADFIGSIDKNYKCNDFSDTHIDEVIRYLSDCKNIIIKDGIFPETTKNMNEKHFCFVLIDCVLYRSIYSSLSYFKDKINKYSNMIIDDYGRTECPGVKLAVDNFLSENRNFNMVALNDFMVNIKIKKI